MLPEHINAPFGRQEVPVLLGHKRLDSSAIDLKQNHDSNERIKKNGSNQLASVVDPVVNSYRDVLPMFGQQLELQEEIVRKLVPIQEEILWNLELSRFQMFKYYNWNDSLSLLHAILKSINLESSLDDY